MATRKTSANENSLGESVQKKKASASKAKSTKKVPAAHKSPGTESKPPKCSETEQCSHESTASESHQRLLHEKEIGLITNVLCRVEKRLDALESAESKSSASPPRLLLEKEVGLITNALCRVEKQLDALESTVSKSSTPHTAAESKCVEFSVPDYEKEIGFSEAFRKALFDFSALMFHGKRPSSFAVYFVNDGVCYVRHVHSMTGLDSVEGVLLLSMCGHHSSQTVSIALSQVYRIVAVD